MSTLCREIAQMIDHSLLRPELTDEDIKQGCEIAKKYGVATVCCNPSAVLLAKKYLDGSNVKVTTVVGFPLGYSKTETKVFETEQAIRDGALEVDMVLNIGKLKGHDFEYVKNDIKAVVDVAHKSRVKVKVILENYYLTDELKKNACRICEEAGADWVKTSTGFAPGGATLEDLRLMRQSVSDNVQIKAAGGIRSLDMAIKVKEAGCSRFGATATVKILEECNEK
ncbi:deoxyribose-phosphate aldolase [bacterium]|nr:deoxyribose-phosphate aldolase [bacterium]RQV97066.1 MAG: deoxyribose-phosphate aldolase [bacterium]